MKCLKSHLLSVGLLTTILFQSFTALAMQEQEQRKNVHEQLIELMQTMYADCRKVKDESRSVTKDQRLHIKLVAAVTFGILEKVKAAIHKGVDVNKKNNFDDLVIKIAIEQATCSFNRRLQDYDTRLKILELLIKSGAQINEKVDKDDMALEYALSFHRPSSEVIKILLDHGAKVNKKCFKNAFLKNNQF